MNRNQEILSHFEARIEQLVELAEQKRTPLEKARDASLAAGGLGVAGASVVVARTAGKVEKEAEGLLKKANHVAATPERVRRRLRSILKGVGLRFK